MRLFFNCYPILCPLVPEMSGGRQHACSCDLQGESAHRGVLQDRVGISSIGRGWRACLVASAFVQFTFNSDLWVYFEGGLGYKLETSFLYVY